MDLYTLENIKHFKFRAAVTGQVIFEAIETFGADASKLEVFKFLGISPSIAKYCLKQRQEMALLKNDGSITS